MAGAIDPGADIGHVHLKVSISSARSYFYRGILGFELMHRYGDLAAFLSAGGYHHHIGLNTWESGAAHRRQRALGALPRRDPPTPHGKSLADGE